MNQQSNIQIKFTKLAKNIQTLHKFHEMLR